MKMKTMLALGVSTALGLGFVANTVTAMPSNPGVPVKKIPFASQISDWTVIDKSTLIVSRSAAKTYLVNLRRECYQLGFSDKVGFSSSNNTIYAGFDYVTAGTQRCAIQSINQLSPADYKLLTKS